MAGKLSASVIVCDAPCEVLLSLENRYGTQSKEKDVQDQGQPNNKTSDKSRDKRDRVRHGRQMLIGSRFDLRKTRLELETRLASNVFISDDGPSSRYRIR